MKLLVSIKTREFAHTLNEVQTNSMITLFKDIFLCPWKLFLAVIKMVMYAAIIRIKGTMKNANVMKTGISVHLEIMIFRRAALKMASNHDRTMPL